MAQRDSICSMSPSLYDQALGPLAAEKRRSMRDDTMWQLYEWQQRQAFSRQPGLYSNMASPKTMINLSEHAAPSHSIPPSPSHGSLSMYGAYSPMRSYNMANARSEFSSPIYRRESSLDRRHRPQVNKVSNAFVFSLCADSVPLGFCIFVCLPLFLFNGSELNLVVLVKKLFVCYLRNMLQKK